MNRPTFEIRSIKYVAGEVTLQRLGGGVVDPQQFESGDEVYLVHASAPREGRGVPQQAPVHACRPYGMTYDLPPVTLSGGQLLEALQFVAPDRDAEQLETEVRIALRDEGRDIDGELRPRGLYCWLAEYPEEGSLELTGDGGLVDEALGGAVASTAAARDVLAERRRQATAKGWTPEHDDSHAAGELSMAALTYLDHVHGEYEPGEVPFNWPWGMASFKPCDRRRNLVKAAALILAEIERLDRATQSGGSA